MTKNERQASKLEAVKGEIEELKLEDSTDIDGASQLYDRADSADDEYGSLGPADLGSTNEAQTILNHTSGSMKKSEQEEGKISDTIGGEITVETEPGKPPKLLRAPSQKVIPKAPQLFRDHGDKTDEATRTFEVMPVCNYSNKYIGYTDLYMDCECTEEWGKG